MGPHPGRYLQRKKLTVRTFGDLKAALAKPQGGPRTPAPPPLRLMTAAKAISPPAQAQPPGASPAAAEPIARLRERRYAALLWMQAAFPAVFDPRRPKPLKLDVHADIWREAKGRVSFPDARKTLGVALARHCASKAYLGALARPGARRCDLNGQPGEAVSAEHRDEAQGRLAEIERERAARREKGPPNERRPELDKTTATTGTSRHRRTE